MYKLTCQYCGDEFTVQYLSELFRRKFCSVICTKFAKTTKNHKWSRDGKSIFRPKKAVII